MKPFPPITTLARAILCGVIIAVSSGCSGPKLFTATVGSEKPLDNFTADQAIRLVLRGYAAQTVVFKVQNMNSGEIVYSDTAFIPAKWPGLIHTIRPLPKGSYYAWATVDGDRVAEWRFSVF
jgi:hypothetical protein